MTRITESVNSNTNMIQSPLAVIPVATYCRVSTEDQEREGTSLDTQRQGCLKYCQEKGYLPIYQFAETASGLILERPKLNELRKLVRVGEIRCLVIYCLDRISRDPTHGVILTQEFEKYGVSLEAVTEDMDNSELGKLINYIRGFAAKLESEKIKERTTRGIRARVIDKRLPVTYRQPYGYSWDKENSRLIPNSYYDTAKLIIDLSINGKSYDYIIAELKRQGIPSPTGLPEWNKHTISAIVRNPVYAGQFYAFKSKVREPERRNGTTYGKTSKEQLPPDQWFHIPEIEVKEPILTLKQRTLLLDQLKKRQNLSQRNAKRNYLLRGMVFCETHRGKRGEPRVYHGQPHYGRWRYSCPVGKCQGAFIDGPELENLVAMQTAIFLGMLDSKDWDATASQMKTTTECLEADIARFRRQENQLISKMAKLEDARFDGQVDEPVYNRLKTQYDNRRRFTLEEQNKLVDEIGRINRAQDVAKSLKDLVHEWKHGLAESLQAFTACDSAERPENLTAFWRQLLTRVNFELHVYPLSATERYLELYNINGKNINCELRYALPIDIALPSPGHG